MKKIASTLDHDEHAPALRRDVQRMARHLPRERRRQVLAWLSAGMFGPALSACGGGDDSPSTGTTATGTTAATTGSTSTATTTGSTSATTTGSTSAGSTTTTGTTTGTTTTSTTTTTGSCAAQPTETNGPYPADGTNSANGSVANVLTQSGVVRSNITGSFGAYSGTATGTPLTLALTLTNTRSSCAPLAGYAIYVWHCDASGNYSMYTVTSANYLRGVQVTDANGQVTFTTIYPGCYSGRWPHIHFEVYATEATATTAPSADELLVSQIAMPETASRAVYAQSNYSGSLQNLNQTSLSSDNVFGNDKGVTQIPSISGSVSAGYVATLTIGLAV